MTLLAGATTADGQQVNVRIEYDIITAVGSLVVPTPGEVVYELAGYVVLPAPAEPHAHLDKALTAERVANPRGDLIGAIEAWDAYRPSLTVCDIADRAERAARLLIANGCTAIRTHLDVAADVGTLGIEALTDVKQRVAGLCDIQIVALMAPAPDDNIALLRVALDAGADIVGGCPHLSDDPRRTAEALLEAAADRNVPIDLHTDETLDPRQSNLANMASWVMKSGFRGGVTASHCCSLGMQDEATQNRVSEAVAEAGISVVALPQTNLFLQSRDRAVAMPRGLTALRALLDAGANLAGGADNIQDPFNSMGRGDPLETAGLLVMAGHLLPEEAYDAVSVGARRAMGLPVGRVEVGAPADLVAIPATSLRGAVAFGPAGRRVWHRGVNVV